VPPGIPSGRRPPNHRYMDRSYRTGGLLRQNTAEWIEPLRNRILPMFVEIVKSGRSGRSRLLRVDRRISLTVRRSVEIVQNGGPDNNGKENPEDPKSCVRSEGKLPGFPTMEVCPEAENRGIILPKGL